MRERDAMRSFVSVIILLFYMWVMYAIFVFGCRIVVWSAGLKVLPW